MSRPPFIGPVKAASPPLPVERECRDCKITKSIDDFPRSSPSKSDNRRFVCKPCCTERTRALHHANPQRLSEYRRQWSQRPDRIVARVMSEKRQREASPEKFLARFALNNAVKRGKLKRLPCERCGEHDAHGHHHDYSKPLDVEWLCRPCHAEAHRELRMLSTGGARQ